MITTLSQLVKMSESAGRLNALRFEAAYHPDKRAYALVKKYHPGLSLQTYDTILASSWGLYQIMGDNLYMLGLKVDILTYWQDADIQEIFFHKYCASRNIAYKLDEVINNQKIRDNFSLRYNGSRAYGARLLTIYNANKAA